MKSAGECLVTFETDNFLRKLLLFFGIGTSEQYYYKVSDVEGMLLNAGLDDMTMAKKGSDNDTGGQPAPLGT